MMGIYGATADPNDPEDCAGAAGDWGGLTINGRSYINTCDSLGECTAEGEGESDPCGGNFPNDSSVTLRYVRVQFAGTLFTDKNELNGIALQGVGSGTVIENVQVHANADDGIEFFGGTVNAKNVVVTMAEDDSIDCTQGWNGQLQNVLVIQDPNPDKADRGIEADNLEQNNDATPRALAEIANATFIGNLGSTGATFRRGTGAKLSNVIFTGFGKCIDIDSEAMFTNGGSAPFPEGLSDALTLENSVLDCTTVYDDEDGDPWLVSEWGNFQPNNLQQAANLDGVYPNESSYFPLDKAKYSDFFQNNGYIGGFPANQDVTWTHNWTLRNSLYTK